MIKKRATCLNCMDGRVQLPVIHWIRRNYHIDFVDVITEAGMDAVLANAAQNIKLILRSIQVSKKLNHSSMVFIVGHHDCRGNPVTKATHLRDIKRAVKRLRREGVTSPLVGIWVNDQWKIEKILEDGPTARRLT